MSVKSDSIFMEVHDATLNASTCFQLQAPFKVDTSVPVSCFIVSFSQRHTECRRDDRVPSSSSAAEPIFCSHNLTHNS